MIAPTLAGSVHVLGSVSSVPEARDRIVYALKREGATGISYTDDSISFRGGIFAGRFRTTPVIQTSTGTLTLRSSSSGVVVSYVLRLGKLVTLAVAVSLGAVIVAAFKHGPDIRLAYIFAIGVVGISAMGWFTAYSRFPSFLRRVLQPVSEPARRL